MSLPSRGSERAPAIAAFTLKRTKGAVGLLPERLMPCPPHSHSVGYSVDASKVEASPPN
jgi:hypothetical protein